MTQDNDDTLRHAKSIRQWELGNGDAPVHAYSDVTVTVKDNGRGERFLYIIDGDGNAGYVTLSDVEEVDLEETDAQELLPEERVEDGWDRKHGVLDDKSR